MSVFSLPYEPRRLQATEARLEAIYNAARKGLRGDTLALAAGMRPSEYRSLCEFDPLAALAEEKGRADGEMEMADVLHAAAREGDAKAALEILRHVHGWVAKQAVTVDATVTHTHKLHLEALQELAAKAPDVIEGQATEVAPPHHAPFQLDVPLPATDADE
jgi:hypothetical protein